ncbi:MAG: biosynthetic peptidoglycan transglycosylase [Fibrobacterota bacterium]
MKEHPALRIFLILLLLVIAAVPAGYYGGRYFAHKYAEKWADKLNRMDQQGLLSTDFGAAWHDIAYQEKLTKELNRINGGAGRSEARTARGIPLQDYPSLSVVERLNRINSYSNTITVRDCRRRTIARIKTDHQRAPYDSLPETFIQALVAAEDENFFTNEYGFEYKSFVRSAVTAALESIRTLRLQKPTGTSGITQQVAKMFVSHLDSKGRRYVARSIDRKLQELQLAAALRQRYSPEEIMEVYANHCITSSHGLIGIADIARGLWNRPVSQLSDAQSVYVSRMVKWGMNYPDKIRRQCRIDMPRIAARLNWSGPKQDSVLAAIDSLTFSKPRRVSTEHGHLIDLANRYWKKFLTDRGYSRDSLQQFDLIDPNSLIRRKGNVTIDLTIDLAVQRKLEEMIAGRGFGADTTILTMARIGSRGEEVTRKAPPADTTDHISVCTKDTVYSEADRNTAVEMKAGDTVFTNIRYRRTEGKNRYRRSLFHYAKRKIPVDGQYYSYAIMDAESGKLRAYASRDKLGSRCVSLFKNPVPNGSSTAKPILNALLFELNKFAPYDKWSDTVTVTDTSLAWHHTFEQRGKSGWATFHNVPAGSPPYKVHNHGWVIDGRDFVYNHLASSNNILGVESAYRLNARVFDSTGELRNNHFRTAQLLYNLNLYDTMKTAFAGREITGPRLYKELCRIVGADVSAISDSLYSVALGTLELTLLEQMHLFNMLHNNRLVERPAEDITLFASGITMEGTAYQLDSIYEPARIYHPFSDINEIRPTLLGLHKRLTSNGYDRLNKYDIPVADSAIPADTVPFSTDLLRRRTPLSNFAKSGTTNDILQPYNKPGWSKKLTNYCHWNAVIRVDMQKLDTTRDSTEMRDLTIACIGEGNYENTGARDGKSLHKYVSRDLLHAAGTPAPNEYYHEYEELLERAWQNAHQQKDSVPDSTAGAGELPGDAAAELFGSTEKGSSDDTSNTDSTINRDAPDAPRKDTMESAE